jgi:hypothetical protein
VSQKEIKLYDDSVIKLTIKQGNESERFPVTNITSGGNSALGSENINLLNYNDISSISGSFASGELAYTRDTNRLFIGNISKNLENRQQQTLGGVLSGNKYLGYIDSRLNVNSDNYANLTIEERGKAINLTDLLSSNSIYRSYNFASKSNTIEYTKDTKWQRLSYYNPTYDAYDGDYMYDIYRNALILFDHNIKPDDGTTYNNATIAGKRKTPLQARWKEEENSLQNNPSKTSVYDYTQDMYGDGYVLLYNIVPDGDTLCFEDKSFDSAGKSFNSNGGADNYSYNVLKLNQIPIDKVYNLLDKSKFFKNEKGLITLFDSSGNGGGTSNGIKIADPSVSKIIINDSDILTQSTISGDELVSLFNELGQNTLKEYVSNIITDSIDPLKEDISNLETLVSEDVIKATIDRITASSLESFKEEVKNDITNDITALKDDNQLIHLSINGHTDNILSIKNNATTFPFYTSNYNLLDKNVLNGFNYVPSDDNPNVLVEKDKELQIVLNNAELLIPANTLESNYYILLGITGTYKLDNGADGATDILFGKSDVYTEHILPYKSENILKIKLDKNSLFEKVTIINSLIIQ